MANIYIYDPADHNALTQALQLANNNIGKDYVISALAAGEPYWQGFRSSKPANYSANANPGDLGEDYNSISPQLQALINSSLAAGNESLPSNAKVHLISSILYPKLDTEIYYKDELSSSSQWTWTKTGNLAEADAPTRWSKGGWISDDVYLDYTGTSSRTDFPGERLVYSDLGTNSRNWKDRYGGSTAHFNAGPQTGLKVEKGDVTIRNYASVVEAFGIDHPTYNDTILNSIDGKKFGHPAVALDITGGNVKFVGNFTIDTVTQTTSNGDWIRIPALVSITGSNTSATFEGAQVVLGSTIGYNSIIEVLNGAKLNIAKSNVYALANSNGSLGWDASQSGGLQWQDFPNSQAMRGPVSIISTQGGNIEIDESLFTREVNNINLKADSIYSLHGNIPRWIRNHYESSTLGDDIVIEGGGNFTARNAKVFASVSLQDARANIEGTTIGGRGINGSLYSSQGFNIKQGGSLNAKKSKIDTIEIVASATPSVTADGETKILFSNNANVPVVAGARAGDSFVTDPKIIKLTQKTGLNFDERNTTNIPREDSFEFYGSDAESNLSTPQQQGPTVGLSQKTVSASQQSIVYQITAVFSQTVGGFGTDDVNKALGDAVNHGWSLQTQPSSSDNGLTWTFNLTAAPNSQDLNFSLKKGAAQALSSNTPSQDSNNTITLSAHPLSLTGAQTANILSYSASWGSLLGDDAVQKDQTLTVQTENLADGKDLRLVLNGITYTAIVQGNKATFSLPTLDLQKLPYGQDQFTVSVNGDPLVPSFDRNFSRGHGSSGTSSGGQAPLITTITPSFGSVVPQTQLSGQSATVTVQTSGLSQATPLVLTINGQPVTTAGGGVVGSNGQAVFQIPASVLTALGSGGHQISVLANGPSGLTASTVTKPFTIAPDSLAGNAAAFPHVDSIAASFGSLLDEREQQAEQQVNVNTSGFNDGDKLTMTLANKTYQATVQNGTATFALPAGDLAKLQSGSVPRIIVSGTNSVGNTAPEHDLLFAVDGSVSSRIILNILPSFGATLDGKESNLNQTVIVETDNFTDGARLVLELNGKNYSSTTIDGKARFSIGSKDLKKLPVGLDRLRILTTDRSQLQAELPFTVEASESSLNAAVNGVKLRGSQKQRDYKGTILRDKITGGSKDDSILGLDGVDHLSGKKGRDLIDAGPGNDYINGGPGGDILTGGDGSDVFAFKRWKDSQAKGAKFLDTITDFDSYDFLDLSALRPKLSYVGESDFTGRRGELRFAQNILGADVNGDKKADFYVDINTPFLLESQLIL